MEYYPKHMVYSKRQQLFLVVYEFSGTTNEVVLYRENVDTQLADSKSSTVKGITRVPYSFTGVPVSLSLCIRQT